MLGKASLKDIKVHNRRLVLQSVINGHAPSRIALSRETGLSPSTVTALVSELMNEEVLVESGLVLPSGGRGRKELKINPEYGLLAVAELGRQRSVLYIFDMSLKKLDERVILERRLSGSNFFFEVSNAIIDYFHKNKDSLPLAGIGLLFQEDMIESDLCVMYSTSLSADNIPLKEALFTQFRVPVIGEYSVNEVFRNINETGAKNSVHLALANTILISLTIDGRPLAMNGGKSANIGRFMPAFQGNGEKKKAKKRCSVLSEAVEILAFVCGMFPLDLILLSGEAVKAVSFISGIRDTLAGILAPDTPPPIKTIEAPGGDLSWKMATRLRGHILNTT